MFGAGSLTTYLLIDKNKDSNSNSESKQDTPSTEENSKPTLSDKELKDLLSYVPNSAGVFFGENNSTIPNGYSENYIDINSIKKEVPLNSVLNKNYMLKDDGLLNKYDGSESVYNFGVQYG